MCYEYRYLCFCLKAERADNNNQHEFNRLPLSTFLVVQQSIVAHEDPVVMEGGGRPTCVEDTRVVF